MVMDPSVDQPVKSLLFVDDDPGVIASLRQLFECDYKIYTANNSRDGIRIFRDVHPDAVCLDLHLPDENGIETLRAIKKDNSEARVVILTGYSTPIARNESRRLGVMDFLSKPFDSVYLKRRMDEILLSERLNLSTTDQRSFHQKTAKPHQKLEEIDYASSAFLHDIASPLSAISLLSGLLVEKFSAGGVSPGKQEESKIADLLKLNSEYMCALVEQWRAFSEPDSLVKHQVNVKEILDHSCFLIQEKLRSKRLELAIHTDSSEQVLYVNRFALSRVLANLLINAIDAVEADTGRIEIHVLANEGDVFFVVRDNGVGISADPLELIFEPRYTTKSTGLGMGLFISKRVVEACNGSISVASRTQGGTEFTIRIPAIS